MCLTPCTNRSKHILLYNSIWFKKCKKGAFVLWFCKKYIRIVTNHGSKKWMVMFPFLGLEGRLIAVTRLHLKS